MMSSKGSYHEYFTVIYRTDSSGESHRVVILNENAKPTPRPPKKKKAYSGFLRNPEKEVTNMPLFEFNPYRRRR